MSDTSFYIIVGSKKIIEDPFFSALIIRTMKINFLSYKNTSPLQLFPHFLIIVSHYCTEKVSVQSIHSNESPPNQTLHNSTHLINQVVVAAVAAATALFLPI